MAVASRRRFLLWVLGLAGFSGLVIGATLLSSLSYSPRELARYGERRALGHNPLIESTGRTLGRLLRRLDGYQLASLEGLPQWAGAHVARSAAMPTGRVVDVVDEATLKGAINAAEPGDVIRLMPGTYRITGPMLQVNRPGRADAPIVVWADKLGEASIEMDSREGFRVAAPYWHFENLLIKGVCQEGSSCEHAFHVVGAAQGFLLRNSRLEDFDAHLKINGERGLFPDGGRLIHNSLLNRAPRRTSLPVTSVDLVAASNWRIEHNLIADFIKQGGDGISYGLFAKGGGAGNQIESNLVICEAALTDEPGQRVGLSFGGGGTSPDACRDGKCIVEQSTSVMRNNVVTRCSDRGIYLNSAAASEVQHNTLLNTSGLTVRYPESSARLRGNLVDGPISSRDGGVLHDEGENRSQLLASYAGWHPLPALFRNADALDLAWRGAPPDGIRSTPGRLSDMCGLPSPEADVAGAFADIAACAKRAEPKAR